ncbi:MAG: hypothetical protein IJX46_07055 [Clostridia bacterium]|nr:hypothetical protein [Clostridia bacterium]
MKHPNFEKLLPLFQAQEDFSLTETQYQKSTGEPLPKDVYYLKRKSALSRVAQDYGYVIDVKEKTICLRNKRK